MPGWKHPGIFYIMFVIIMNYSLQDFANLIRACNGVILYKPLPGEIDYTKNHFPFQLHTNQIMLPPDKDEDPFAWANKCADYFKKETPYILVPGTSFDIYGTRYGKGDGWYDRFLSKIPHTWLRVGVTFKSRLSNERLLRQSWDQPVDFVISSSNGLYDIFKIKPST